MIKLWPSNQSIDFDELFSMIPIITHMDLVVKSFWAKTKKMTTRLWTCLLTTIWYIFDKWLIKFYLAMSKLSNGILLSILWQDLTKIQPFKVDMSNFLSKYLPKSPWPRHESYRTWFFTSNSVNSLPIIFVKLSNDS